MNNFKQYLDALSILNPTNTFIYIMNLLINCRNLILSQLIQLLDNIYYSYFVRTLLLDFLKI